MKNILYYSSLILLLFFYSCSEEYFDTEEVASLTPEEAFVDANLVNAAVIGTYDRFQTSDYLGRNYMVIPEIASDNAKISTNNSGRFIQEYNFSMIASSGDALGVFDAAYEVIHAANLIIANIDNCEECTEDETNRALAHAYGLRGLAHFDLVRLFAFPYNLTDPSAAPNANGNGGHLGVPIITSASPEDFPSRNTVAEVFQQVIGDLLKSENLFTPLNYEGSSYFSKYAAQALLARVYLYKEDYENARLYANKLINDAPFSLVSHADYLNSWKVVGSSETIFEISFSKNDYPGTNSLGYIYVGYRDIKASDNFYNTLEVDDIRKGLYQSSAGEYINKKYLQRDGVLGLANTPVLRLSEMYLIKAEAEAKLGGLDASAILALDAVKSRANPSSPNTNLSGAALIQEIALERRKELAFEGHRLFDLLRYKQGVHRDASDIVGTAPQDVNYPNPKLIFPIPQDEMNVNTNMVQNIGY